MKKEHMDDSQLTDAELFLQDGLQTDLIWCEVHYFIYRTLGENAEIINEQSNENFVRQVAYLQNSSQELMLLCLARIYDKRSKRYEVRCLDTLLDKCISSNSGNFPLILEYYPALGMVSDFTGIDLNDEDCESSETLTQYLRKILNSERVVSCMKNLHLIRSKTIV